MLKLETPITLGSSTYDNKVLRLIQIDLPHRIFNFVLGAAREEADYIHIGTEEYSETNGRTFRLAGVTIPWGIQPDGLGNDDPRIIQLLEALKPFLKKAETVIEESQDGPGGLAEHEQELGEDRFRIKVKRVSTNGKPVQVKKIKKA